MRHQQRIMSYEKYHKQSFKAIALDLDGTLLDSNKKVSENTKVVLQYVQKHFNVEILLISGRPPYLVEFAADALGINCYVIGYNGAEGWTKKGNNFYNCPV